MTTRQFIYRCKDKKEDPRIIVTWLRHNFGHRGVGWDFCLMSGNVMIEISDPRLQTLYILAKE